jgi:hypothetical protein
VGFEGAGTASVRGDAEEPAGGGGRRVGSTTATQRNPLADLRPVSVGAVLDGGVELLRHRFGRLILMTACLFVPVWLLHLLMAVVAPPSATGQAATSGPTLLWSSLATGADTPLSGLVGILQLVALSLLGVVIGHYAMATARGEDPELRELGAVALRRWWVAVLIVPLTSVVHVVAACLGGIGWILGDAFVFLTSVAAGAERLGPWRAFVRSWSLTRSAYGRALLICFGGLVITQLIRWSLAIGPTALVVALAPESPLVGLFGAATTAVLLITEPLTACLAARAYLDLRCRHDGLDLAMRHERLLGTGARP